MGGGGGGGAEVGGGQFSACGMELNILLQYVMPIYRLDAGGFLRLSWLTHSPELTFENSH